MIKEDVSDRIDDMLSIAKGRIMIARRLAVMVQQSETKYSQHVRGDLNVVGDEDGDEEEDGVKNPIPRDTTKRQKRYPSKHERAKKQKTT